MFFKEKVTSIYANDFFPPSLLVAFFSRAASSQEEPKVGKDFSVTWCLFGGWGLVMGRDPVWFDFTKCVLELMGETVEGRVGGEAHFFKF